jgi:hypothetical protein
VRCSCRTRHARHEAHGCAGGCGFAPRPPHRPRPRLQSAGSCTCVRARARARACLRLAHACALGGVLTEAGLRTNACLFVARVRQVAACKM